MMMTKKNLQALVTLILILHNKSYLYYAVETVRLLLNSIGNKSPRPDNKMSVFSVDLVFKEELNLLLKVFDF